jgi:hypothetical protein
MTLVKGFRKIREVPQKPPSNEPHVIFYESEGLGRRVYKTFDGNWNTNPEKAIQYPEDKAIQWSEFYRINHQIRTCGYITLEEARTC